MARKPAIQWREPPRPPRGHPPSGGRARDPMIDATVDVLRGSPGKWALVRQRTSSTNRQTWLKRGCEVRCSTIAADGARHENGQCDIYARWPDEDVS